MICGSLGYQKKFAEVYELWGNSADRRAENEPKCYFEDLGPGFVLILIP